MLLASDDAIDQRRAVAAGPMAALADSLADDLDRLLPDDDFYIPPEKARMTRRGGRCERDGAFLEFDPRQPRRHRCPLCGSEYDADEHYRWWIMGYQLWLAERAVHAATLWRVRNKPRHRSLAEAILSRLADAYLTYPDEDNVLGPTRVFFSTYLESIWSLQLSLAVSLLEAGASSPVGDRVRDQILAPSSELVASFDEGMSNRQVWNSAALGAAGLLLDSPSMVDKSLRTLDEHLRNGMLHDGTWYEGENYHLFAHRGLWHLVSMAEHLGAQPSAEAMCRFEMGFVAPLRTALPDFTFPSRRDSQYRASLRQWRIAESLELGRARATDTSEHSAGLGTLYGEGPDGDPARWRSTAEAERNVPGVRLTRANLGWKSLLFARPDEPAGESIVPSSALMDGQGFAVIRRDMGKTYAALDYGHTGGTHGHPDRLNLWLVHDDSRVFEDVGTGSYVEQTLHWYRSTLAHNAPLVDGRSQQPVAGVLRAWDERDGFSWVDAEAEVAAGVLVRRTVVVGPDHLVDSIEWTADREVVLDLPFHVEADVEGANWAPGSLGGSMDGGEGLEDGFSFVTQAERTTGTQAPMRILSPDIAGALYSDGSWELWRAVAPGPPREADRKFLLVRRRGSSGTVTSVWSWNHGVDMHPPEHGVMRVSIGSSTYSHRMTGDTWHVTHDAVAVMLDGRRPKPPRAARVAETMEKGTMVIRATTGAPGLRFDLGKANYRRTEVTWEEAGSPSASVAIRATRDDVAITVAVPNSNPNFVALRESNPLDNEHPDVNSDGVQIHLTAPGAGDRSVEAAWLIVPERNAVRVHGRDSATPIPLGLSVHQSETGWALEVRIPRVALGVPNARFGLDVIVNEMPHGRERRRGQLVLSGRGSGWAYLRGDRQDRESLIQMVVRDG